MASRRPAPRGYTRIDQPENNNHGRFVRVGYYKRRDGTWKARHVRFFGDYTYGGKLKAKRAAAAFVAKVQREARAEERAKAARKKPRRAAAKRAAGTKSRRKTRR
jgi:hypothetical protein